jgi:cellulose synthase/poly-beta-1,6-N-acetylglucosamine synthase-like glycosyltransferase
VLAASLERLEALDPAASARTGLWPGQRRALIIVAALFCVLVFGDPARLWLILDIFFGIVFALLLAIRVIALWHVLATGRCDPPSLASVSRSDPELPTYSVLVALYGEAAVVPQLLRAMAELDYPVTCLEILFILETDDAATRYALVSAGLLPHMRLVIVPAGLPRTKPRALSYALAEASGTFVVVYDAEDIPDRDQLKRAVDHFATGGSDLGCLQARLVIDNGGQGWLAGQFAVEYLVLFHAVLPALARFGLPVPLGGTSNHFRRAVLDAVGGWDPYNVTEDADLGYRLARAGYRVAILDSATAEEAPPRWRVWRRQRTRWQKGWMQTYLVHQRQPRRLYGDLGLPGWLAFQLVLGGGLASALAHPLFVAVTLWRAVGAEVIATPVHQFSVLILFAAALVTVALALTVVARCGARHLMGHALILPFYWLPISCAAYFALWELARAPFYWAKTPHGDGIRRSAQRR